MRDAIMWTFFSIYIIAIISMGYYFYKKTKTTSDYFIADRSLPLLAGAGSFGATFVSAGSLMSFIGFSYIYGWSIFPARLLAFGVGWSILFFMAIWYRRFGQVTMVDFITTRFYSGNFLRLYSAILILIVTVLSMVGQMMGIGKLFHTITGMPYLLSTMLVGIVIIVYVTAGGMRAVAWTDLIQYCIFFLTVIVIAFVIYGRVGWITKVNAAIAPLTSAKNPEPGSMLDWTKGLGTWTILGISIAVMTQIPTSPRYVQIVNSMKSTRDAGKIIALGALFTTVFYIMLFYSGVASRAMLGDIPQLLDDPDYTMPYMLYNVFPSIVSGFTLAAICAAIMSTLDTMLIAAGTIVGRDIYQKFVNPKATDNQVLKVARIGTILLGIFAIAGATGKFIGMFWLGVFSSALRGAALFFPILFGFIWWRATREGMIAGSISGFVVALLVNIFKKQWLALSGGIPNTFPGLIVSLVVFVVVSLLTKPAPDEVLKQFFPKRMKKLG